MPPRRKAKITAEKPQQPFEYPKIDREILDDVRRRSHEDPWKLSKHAETLIDNLPEDLRLALWHDFGQTAVEYTGGDRKTTNLNLARFIVAFSMQIEANGLAAKAPK